MAKSKVLLDGNQSQFEIELQQMNIHELQNAVGTLQDATIKEQKRFNELTNLLSEKMSGDIELATINIKKSHERLQNLMDRSMRCALQLKQLSSNGNGYSVNDITAANSLNESNTGTLLDNNMEKLFSPVEINQNKISVRATNKTDHEISAKSSYQNKEVNKSVSSVEFSEPDIYDDLNIPYVLPKVSDLRHKFENSANLMEISKRALSCEKLFDPDKKQSLQDVNSNQSIKRQSWQNSAKQKSGNDVIHTELSKGRKMSSVTIKFSTSSENHDYVDQSSNSFSVLQRSSTEMPLSVKYTANSETSDLPINAIVDYKKFAEVKSVLAENSVPSSETTVSGIKDISPSSTTNSLAKLSIMSDKQNIDDGFAATDKVISPASTKTWDPRRLLREMYSIYMLPESSPAHQYVNMFGYMEKLPLNTKKTADLKAWKRRFFDVKDGWLYYYETEGVGKPQCSLQLSGGKVEESGDNVLTVDDGRGRCLVIRCPSSQEFHDWKTALLSQIVPMSINNYHRPLLRMQHHQHKNVVVIDIGSTAIRAGLLAEKPTLPNVFFPSVCVSDKNHQQFTVGIDAFCPELRDQGVLLYPIRSVACSDKSSFDTDCMPSMFDKIFIELGIQPSSYEVMISIPSSFGDTVREQMMSVLIERLGVQSVCVMEQALLALYSYNTKSGIIVDIGERLDIIPVTDGYIINGGIMRNSSGGAMLRNSVVSSFAEKRYRFISHTEKLLAKFAVEKMCFVSSDFVNDSKQCNSDPDMFKEIIDLSPYDLPSGTWTHLTNDVGRFKSAEGLFDPQLWGADFPSLTQLVRQAVQACPMDIRREMWRSIYLSGGTSLLPGLAERLKNELSKLVSASINVEVHTSPYRYHAAFIGACVFANLNDFRQCCITADEWKSKGALCLRKWHNY